MAKTTDSDDTQDQASAHSSRVSRLTRIAILLLAVQATALGLKAWQDLTATQSAAYSSQVEEALELSDTLDRRIREVHRAFILLEEVQSSGDGAEPILENALPSVEHAVRIAPHSPAADGLPPQALVSARALMSDDQGAALYDGGLVITHRLQNEVWATAVKLESWLPSPSAQQVFVLSNGLSQTGLGSPPLLQSVEASTARTGSGIGLAARTSALQTMVSHCTAVSNTSLTLCAGQRVGLLSATSALDALVYILLFLGPTLAIFSLIRALQHHKIEETETAGQTSKLEHQLDLTFSEAKCGVWEWLLETDEVILSPHLAKMMGSEEITQMTGQQWLSYIHPDDRERIRSSLYGVPKTKQIEATFRAPKSLTNARFIELRGHLDWSRSQRNLTYVTGIAIDVSERRIVEERVRFAERRLRESIEGFPGPFALWDRRRRLLYWNKAFADDFKLGRNNLQRGQSYNVISVEMAKAVRQERESESSPDIREIALIDNRWFQLTETETPDGCMVLVGVDISAIKSSQEALLKNEKQLKRLVVDLERSEGHAAELTRKYGEEKVKAEQASKTKGAFLANMSHELRTPLNAINGFSEILVKELFGPMGDARYKDYAKDILLSGQHLLDMINDILDMAKIEAGKMSVNLRPIDPLEPIDAAVRMIRRRAEDKNVRLDFVFDDDVPELEADHRAIKQMVLNLVSNAIKFTDPGGEITVSAKRLDDCVRVSVSDTGVGISEEDLPRLAQPFEQVKNQHDESQAGTGLGLALTKSFAEMHGGSFDIESQVGEGTTVSFSLPIRDAAHSPAPAKVA